MKKLILMAYIFYGPLQLKLPNIPGMPLMNIFFLLMMGILISSKDSSLKKPHFEVPLNIFLVLWIISFIYGLMFTVGMPRLEITREFKRLFTLPLGYFVFSRCMQEKKDVHFYVKIFLLCLLLVGYNTFYNGVLGGSNYGDHKRSSGPFGWGWAASDIAGGFLAIFTPFMFSYFLFENKKLLKMIGLVGVGVCTMGLFATYSRGSMIGLAAGFTVITLLSFKQLMKGSKFNFLVIFFVLVVAVIRWDAWVPESIVTRVSGTIEADHLDDAGDLDLSSRKRIEAWEEGLEVFLENPITGVGFRQVQYQLSHDPHNAFLLVGGEMGIVGLLVFLWFVFAVLFEARKLISTEYNMLGFGFIGAMCAFMIVNFFYSNFFRDTVINSFWVMLGLLASALSHAQNPDIKAEKKKKERVRVDYGYNHRRYQRRGGMAIVFLFLFLFSAQNVCAEITSRWWSELDIPKLSAYHDLKIGTGRIFYVDGKNGNDENNGTTLKTPYKTIAKAVGKKGRLKPGDTVLIKAGTYRERSWVAQKGTATNPIIVGPYGDGEVIIDASSVNAGVWKKYKGNIYVADCPEPVRAIVVDEQPLFPEYSLKKVKEGRWFNDRDGKKLYLHIPGGGDPTIHDVGLIEDNKYRAGLFLNGAEYVTIYGLTIKYSGGKAIDILGKNNRIERCNLKFNGNHGIGMYSYGDQSSDNAEILYNHVYHNFLRNWPRGVFKSGAWGMGVGGGGAPNTKFIGNIVHKNGGEGIGASGDGSLIYDNKVYDNWSVNIYVDGKKNVVIDQNLIYCSEPNLSELYNNRDKHPKDGKNIRRLRAEGVMTADENNPAKLRNIQITNNIIIGCRRGITHYAKAKDSGLKNVLVAHNTIIVPNAKGTGEDYVGIRVPFNRGNNVESVYRNNIVYGLHPSTKLVAVSTNPVGWTKSFKGIKFDHNVWYHKSNPRPFHLGATWTPNFDMDFKKWFKKAQKEGQAKGSMFRDPGFLKVKSYTADYVGLKPDSKAIDAGSLIEGIVTDYNNLERKGTPDIGAVEFIGNN